MQNQLTTRAFDDEIDSKEWAGYKTCEYRRDAAEAAASAGNVEEAIRLYEQNLAWCEKTLPRPHFLTVMHQERLAEHYRRVDQFDKAVQFYWDVYTARNELDTDCEETINALKWYAWALLQDRKEEMAAGFFSILLKKQEKSPLFGRDHPDTLSTMSDMACCLYRLWKQDQNQTESLQKAAAAHESLVERSEGLPSLTLVNNRLDLAKDYIALGRYDEATWLLEENLRSIPTWQKDGHFDKEEARKAEVSNLKCQSTLARALRKLEDAKKDARGKPRSGSLDTARSAKLSREDLVERPASATLRSPFTGLYFEFETPEDSNLGGHSASPRDRSGSRGEKKTTTSERSATDGGGSSSRKERDRASKKSDPDERSAGFLHPSDSIGRRKTPSVERSAAKRPSSPSPETSEAGTSRARKASSARQSEERAEVKSPDIKERHVEPRKRPKTPKTPVIVIPTTEDAATRSRPRTDLDTTRASKRSCSTEAVRGHPRIPIDSSGSGPEASKSRQQRSSSDSRCDAQRGEAAASSPRSIPSPMRSPSRSQRKSSPDRKSDKVPKKHQVDTDGPGSQEKPIKPPLDKLQNRSRRKSSLATKGEEDSNKSQVDAGGLGEKEKPVGLPDDQIKTRSPRKSSPETKNDEVSSKNQVDADDSGNKGKPLELLEHLKSRSHRRSSSMSAAKNEEDSSKNQVDADGSGSTGKPVGLLEHLISRSHRRSSSMSAAKNEEDPNKNQVDADGPGEKENPIDDLPQVQSPGPSRTPDRMRDGTLLLGHFGYLSVDNLQDEDLGVHDWFERIAEINDKILGPLRKNRERRVKIAVLDSGVEMSNPNILAFKERIKKRKDFLDTEGDASDSHGHGTCCVNLIHRVAPEADIYVGKITNGPERIRGDVAAMAIEKALGSDRGCWNVDILSLSFGFGYREENIEKMLQKYERGKIILAAASNHGTRRSMTYPASRYGVIAVNSATGDGSISTYNPPLNGVNNLSILGEKVQSAWVPKTTKIMSGTSVATPIAAGIAALLLEIAIKQNDSVGDEMAKWLENLVKDYGGMTTLLRSMSSAEKKDDKYFNILPWQLLAVDEHILDPGQTLISVAAYGMRRVFVEANLWPRLQ